MSELLACRVCLATDLKLYNIRQCGLTQSLQTVIGYALPVSDGLPQHVCCYCASLLRKVARFNTVYKEAQTLLTGMLMTNQMVTTENLRSVHRNHNQLWVHRPTVHRCLPLHCSWDETSCKEELVKSEGPCENQGPCESQGPCENQGPCKSEIVECAPLEDGVKSEAEEFADDVGADGAGSDDEPLSRKRAARGVSAGVRRRRRGAVVEELGPHAKLLNVDVVLLSKEEQIAEVQARRSSANYLSSPLQCQSCYKGFLNDTTYRNHMDLHDPKTGAHACDVCRQRFPAARKLSAHVRATHAARYLCRLCPHAAHSSHRARLHQKWHQGVTYDCHICGKSFSKVTTHLTHLRLAHAQAQASAHRCARCGAAFLSAAGLHSHVSRAHRTREWSDAARCELCQLPFLTAAALALHQRSAAGHHPAAHPDMDKHCTTCGESFSSEAALHAHADTHSRGKARACSECGVKCKDERAYTAHYRRAHLPSAPTPTSGGKQRNYVCEHCGYKCVSNATLSYHLRVHSGEKPHACSVCARGFRLHEQLQIHMRLHTGERPFACSACPKAFVHKAALNRHARVHTGAKPYACAHCGKAFSQSNSMKLHVNTVHLRIPPARRVRAKHAE